MKVLSLFVLFALALSFSNETLASVVIKNDDPAFIIDQMTLEELHVPLVELDNTPTAPTNPIGEISIIVDSLIALGKKIWPIVEAGKPVITDRLATSVSVIPNTNLAGAVLYQMENWSVPRVKRYRVAYKNKLGSEVAAFTYTVYFQYNGAWDGKGKYLTSVKVEASEIYLSWGFNFDATSELVNIANVGTKDQPIASGIVQVAYTVKSVLTEVRSAQSFYMDGEGNIQLLNN